jgi:hypothetical protein
LVESLKMHAISQGELTDIVKSHGVDFELTPEKSSQLKTAGADAVLLAAIGSSYRNATPVEASASPRETAAAGSAPPRPVTPVAQPEPTTPASLLPSTVAASVSATSVSSIREVKKLYIEKMSNNLDDYIKAELSRQIPGRILVVLRREDADAVMKGGSNNGDGSVTITDLRGTVELWNGKAGDKGVFLTKIHGGEQEIAKRLVSNLRRALY